MFYGIIIFKLKYIGVIFIMKKKYLPYLLPLRCIIFLSIFIASIVNIFTIMILVFISKHNNSSYLNLINYQKGKSTIKQIVIISIIILIIGMGGMYFAGYICYGIIPYAAPMMISPIPLWLAILNIAILPISTALAEEGLYLGCGVNQINNKYLAIIIPALFFALQHSFIPTLFDAVYIAYRFLSFLPLTLILCGIYYKKRDPLPIMIGHTIIDFATVMQIFATSLIPGLYETMCSM